MMSARLTITILNWACPIVENGVTHKDKEIIANKCNHFFTNIAQTLAREIKYDGNKNYKYYLNKRIDTVFTFQNIGNG